MNVDFSQTTSYSLLDRSMAGEAEAWSRLNEIYTPMVYTWVRQCGLQAADARDITQQTFIKVLQGLSVFERGQGRFRGWLWTISRNLVRDFMKAKKPNLLDDWETLHNVPANAQSSDEPPSEVIERALRFVLEEYDERYEHIAREVIVQGRKATDVAAELGMTPNALYVAKSRILKKLRALLAHLEYPSD